VTKARRAAATPKVPRITYATLAITPEDDRAYDAAVSELRGRLGRHFTNFINGEARPAAEEVEHKSPVDTRIVVSCFAKGTREDVRDAIQAARAAFEPWSAMDYRERIKILRRAADLIVERRYELAAWMAFEVGKNRAEALAEVNEAAELIRYYSERKKRTTALCFPSSPPGPGRRR
jgi:1-pyrroline-5-carboxylate dehydrogenase